MMIVSPFVATCNFTPFSLASFLLLTSSFFPTVSAISSPQSFVSFMGMDQDPALYYQNGMPMFFTFKATAFPTIKQKKNCFVYIFTVGLPLLIKLIL